MYINLRVTLSFCVGTILDKYTNVASVRNTTGDALNALSGRPTPGNVGLTIARCRLRVECVARDSDI